MIVTRIVGYLSSHIIQQAISGIIVLFKKNHEILLDLADFALQEQPEDNLLVAISQAWYNGSYTMATKPIKSLELYYTMIQLNNYFECRRRRVILRNKKNR